MLASTVKTYKDLYNKVDQILNNILLKRHKVKVKERN